MDDHLPAPDGAATAARQAPASADHPWREASALERRIRARGGTATQARLLALKLWNLLTADGHFRRADRTLESRPLKLLVDPANACQLRCPGCIHSANPAWRETFDWPAGVLSPERFEALLAKLGPFAFAAVFYNYGEPLLNRQFPRLVAAARSYGLATVTSTNLSLPIDADAIVASGVDRITVSIDGTSQATYARFRRRGSLDVVLKNVARLVAARRAAAHCRPELVWQFLTFEHNRHEVAGAIALADELGFDAIDVREPFDVARDDPGIRAAASEHAGTIVFRPMPEPSNEQMASTAASGAAVDAAWRDLLRVRSPERLPGAAAPSGVPCRWLYDNLTVDATGRLLPCCMAPKAAGHSEGELVLGTVDQLDHGNPMNLDRAIAARDRRHPMRCASCADRPSSPWSDDYAGHLRQLDLWQTIPPRLLQQQYFPAP
ncbi:MAG: radical SAM protein [Pseudomonadota bacterium]